MTSTFHPKNICFQNKFKYNKKTYNNKTNYTPIIYVFVYYPIEDVFITYLAGRYIMVPSFIYNNKPDELQNNISISCNRSTGLDLNGTNMKFLCSYVGNCSNKRPCTTLLYIYTKVNIKLKFSEHIYLLPRSSITDVSPNIQGKQINLLLKNSIDFLQYIFNAIQV
jgi:hypothetical protein